MKFKNKVREMRKTDYSIILAKFNQILLKLMRWANTDNLDRSYLLYLDLEYCFLYFDRTIKNE